MKAILKGVLILGVALMTAGGAWAEDKKEQRRVGDIPLDIEKLLEHLGGGLSEEQLKELMKEAQELFQQFQKGQGFQGGFPLFPPMPGLGGRARGVPSAQEGRLGVTLRAPSQAMIDQLDLPKDEGLVVEEVGANSAASKAGLRANDILLEVDGKAVSSRKGEFDKSLAEVKADQAVDVVVMRKGKKETLKGLTLPEAKAVRALPRVGPGLFPRLPGGLGGGGQGDSTSVTRTNDEFTVKHKGDGVSVTIKGKVTQGKAEPAEIRIEADGKTETYAGLDKVPAEQQGLVKRLLGLAAGRGKPRAQDEF